VKLLIRAFTVLSAVAIAYGGTATAVSASGTAFSPVVPIFDEIEKNLYVGDEATNSVQIYPAGVLNPKRIGTIAKGISSPLDVAVDRDGTLYVLNSKPSRVTVYRHGENAPFRSILVYSRFPYHLAVGPTGTIYLLSNALDNTNQFSILEYDRGSNRLSRVIKLPIYFPYPIEAATGIATDSADTVYVNSCSFNAGGGCSISVYPSKSIISSGSYNIDYNYPDGALAIDHENQIIVGDSYDDAILAKQLPLNSYGYRSFAAAQTGDLLAIDPESQFLYAYSFQNDVTDIFAFRTGQLLGTLPGKGDGGLAVGR
jgi:DNA-binding beta-propeller fold protein YncE